MKLFILVNFTFLSIQMGFAQLKLQAKEPPVEMESLAFLVGKWSGDDGEWFDDKGNPMKIERGKGAPDSKKTPFEIAPIMGGLYLEGGQGSDAVRSYFYFNTTEKAYYHIAIDFMGSISLMSGGWQSNNLVLTDIKAQKHPIEGTIMWKRTFFDIGDSAYSFSYEYSRDEGRTWKLRGRQTMNRVGE